MPFDEVVKFIFLLTVDSLDDVLDFVNEDIPSSFSQIKFV